MITPRTAMCAHDVGRHYDQLDEFYREIWGDHVHHGLWLTGREAPEVATVQLIDRLADEAQIADGLHVVDIGCGYGGTSRHLALSRRARVTGFTVSHKQHAYAVSPDVERIFQSAADNPDATYPTFHLCRWEENQLPDESMDAAISIECFTHVPDKRVFLSEIHRVLKPGGRAALAVWMHNEDPRPWHVRRLIEPICYEGRLAGMGCASEYRTLIEESGLTILEHEDWSPRVRRTWWICARRLVGRILSSSKYRQALRNSELDNRVFALTLARILFAYHWGVMRYGFFCLQRPA